MCICMYVCIPSAPGVILVEMDVVSLKVLVLDKWIFMRANACVIVGARVSCCSTVKAILI